MSGIVSDHAQEDYDDGGAIVSTTYLPATASVYAVRIEPAEVRDEDNPGVTYHAVKAWVLKGSERSSSRTRLVPLVVAPWDIGPVSCLVEADSDEPDTDWLGITEASGNELEHEREGWSSHAKGILDMRREQTRDKVDVEEVLRTTIKWIDERDINGEVQGSLSGSPFVPATAKDVHTALKVGNLIPALSVVKKGGPSWRGLPMAVAVFPALYHHLVEQDALEYIPGGYRLTSVGERLVKHLDTLIVAEPPMVAGED